MKEVQMSGDLISREELKKAMWSLVINENDDIPVLNAIETIDNAPTVEPICPYLSDNEVKQPCLNSPCERPQGEWIEKEETPASVSYYCSVCKLEGIPITPFCPWCGASMKGGAE